MNLDFNTFMQLLLYGWLTTVLIIATFTDLYQRRIPNMVTLPTLIVAPPTYFIVNGLDGFLFSLTGLGFGFIVFFIPYLFGAMGAGDVKLMSAVGAVLGLWQTIVALLFIALAGGVLAFGQIIYQGTFKQTLSKMFWSLWFLGAHQDVSQLKVNKEELSQDGIPFGVAIATGVCLFLIYILFNKNMIPAMAVM